MLVSLQLEARYFSSAIRLMSVQSKSMKKKQRIKAEKAGKIHILILTDCFHLVKYRLSINTLILLFNFKLDGY